LKGKKLKLEDINQEFQEEIRNSAEKLYFYLSDYIDDKIVESKNKFQEIIEGETRCDELKENYIRLLFKERRALPFLVEDRYTIIILFDKIMNKLELIARYMQINPFKLDLEIKEDMKEYIKLYYNTVIQLLNLSLLMEKNFRGAYEITFEIERLRLEAHNLKFKILESIFKKTDEPLKVNLTWKLISLIYDVISYAEEISDFLRGLIMKYPRR
jgi:predicted phosphate transport protein (TIGR00153 family)